MECSRVTLLRRLLAMLVLGWAGLGWAGAAHGGGGPDCYTDWRLEPFYPPLEAPFVFETVELSDGSGRQYAVVFAPCGEVACPFEVQLRDGPTVYDAVWLDECSVAQQPRLADVDSVLGVGDPLRPDGGIRLWYTGFEDSFVSLHARPIDLAPNRRGLLVHMIGGYEHIWRNHYLFVVRDDRLILAWSASEVAGVGLVAIHLADTDGNGYPEILYYQESQIDFGDYVSSSVRAGVYRWDDHAGKMEGLTVAQAAVPIYAAVGAVFSTLEATLDARRESNSCLLWYYAMPKDYISGVKPGRYTLNKFTWQKPLAEAKLRACDPTGEGYVATFTDFPAPYDIVPPD